MPTPADLRRNVAKLTDLAERDVRLLVADLDDFVTREVALNDALPLLVEAYGAAAATVAADWYDSLREEHSIPGRFAAIAATPPATLGIAELVGWARAESTSPDSMLELVIGGVQKRIANGSRATVMGSSLADPRAEGWMRVGIGACRFCQMLISRGAVYSESSVRFGAHDHDRCQAAPSWGRPSDIFDVDDYRRSLRNRSDSVREADSARAREWIADHL